jgi:OmpA family
VYYIWLGGGLRNVGSNVLHDSSEGGVAGKYPEADDFQILVGSTTANEMNTVHLRLIPIACWRLDDIRFDFDSSFVTPEITTELRMLIRLREAHKKNDSGKAQYPPLSVFGHADPTGSDAYNKALSGRRAGVIYALLISGMEPGRALSIWRQMARTECWGEPQLQAMRAKTGLPDGTPEDRLFQVYMQSLCPPELQISSKDFLAQGADAGGKGDYQGCGELNPVLVFSQEEQAQFEHAAKSQDKAAVSERNAANEPNRRVVALLFRPGSKVVAAKWPCPRASEDDRSCRLRFWSDGERRRTTHQPGVERKFEEVHDTFACRFYHRLTGGSPCERVVKSTLVRLYDGFGFAIPFARYKVSSGSEEFGEQRTADERGIIALSGLEIPCSCRVIWGFPPDDGEEAAYLFSRTVFLLSESEAGEDALVKKLNNLGYGGKDQADNITGFQLDYGCETDPPLEVTGQWDQATVNLLTTVYNRNERDLRKTKTM